MSDLGMAVAWHEALVRERAAAAFAELEAKLVDPLIENLRKRLDEDGFRGQRTASALQHSDAYRAVTIGLHPLPWPEGYSPWA